MTNLYFDVIQMRVLQLIRYHFVYGNSFIVEQWIGHFNGLVNTGETDFFALAVSSFQYTNQQLEELVGVSNSNNESATSDGNDMDLPTIVESSP